MSADGGVPPSAQSTEGIAKYALENAYYSLSNLYKYENAYCTYHDSA